MSKHKDIELIFLPENIKWSVEEGITFKKALKKAGIKIKYPCGGDGKCKKCLIEIKEHTEEAVWETELACLKKVQEPVFIRTNLKVNFEEKKK